MPALRVMKDGLLNMLGNAFGRWTRTSYHVHLYQSDITPAAGDVLSSYSGAEADFSGYAAVSVPAWNDPTWDGTAKVATITAAAAVTFTVSASPSVTNGIYGYYVTRDSDGALMWAQRFDGTLPLAMTNGGDTLTFTPQYTDQSLNS